MIRALLSVLLVALLPVANAEGLSLRLVEEGDKIKKDQVIGMAQDLEKRYPDITPHIHYEVRYKGDFIDPEGIA